MIWTKLNDLQKEIRKNLNKLLVEKQKMKVEERLQRSRDTSKDIKILFVEDQANTRQIVVNYYLKDSGYNNVTAVADGKQAVDAINKSLIIDEPFDIIISDWNIPFVSGLELLKKIRSHKTMKDKIFIMATCHDSQVDIVNAAEAGVDDYIVKPFSPETLVNKLKKLAS